MSDLMTYVEENIAGLKVQALLVSYHQENCGKKIQMLKKRLVVATALAAGVAAIPLPGIYVAINTVCLVH